MLRRYLAAACLLTAAPFAAAQTPPDGPPGAEVVSRVSTSPLQPIRSDHPRDTMASFLHAMDRHVVALRAGDPLADVWLADAVRCLDLSGLAGVGREEVGRNSAILLKEIIDRVIEIDLAKVPDDVSLTRWRLSGTEIAVVRMEEGPRRGEFLFSSATVEHAPAFFAKVKELPLLPGKLGGGWAPPLVERWFPAEFQYEWLGVKVWQWLLMGLLIFVGLIVGRVARLLAYFVKQLTQRTKSSFDDDLVGVLRGPLVHLSTTGIWFASLHLLGVTGQAYTVVSFLIKGAFFINLAYLAYNLAGFVGAQLEQRLRAQRRDLSDSVFKLLRQTLKLLALVFCLLLGAQNMGMDVASLVAGLGLGGLAVALAAKDTLANLFGFFMILIDRPYRVGDWVVAKGAEGTVEEIGYRSTRIRTFYNSVVSIPNSELVMTNIDNYGMREYRRIYETLGITYGTPPEKIEAFCEGIKHIILANPFARRDYLQVYFHKFGDFSLNIMVYFFVKCPDWSTELEQRQRIFLEIARLAERLGVAFAFPTQTLHLESTPERPPQPQALPPREELAATARLFAAGGQQARPEGAGLYTPRHRELQAEKA